MSKNSQVYIDFGQGFSLMMGLPTIPSWKTIGRPKKPKKGTFGFNAQTNNLEYWDGDVWYEAQLKEQ